MKITAAQWARVSRLLDEALEIEPASRDRWLESLAAEHADLRGTLRELLRAEGGIETANFLPNLSQLMERAEVGVGAGEQVGPYRLLRELGSGGMASVWLAERADGSPRRQVALKLPRLFSDARLAVRLARERDILAALEHPNIARLYDAGVDAKGRPFLAMEYVDGLPLDVYSRENALSRRQRIDLFLQIARAVAFAHGRLIVHSDLKPANILVTRAGEVRLLDFGIARLLQADPSTGLHHTQIGVRVFTPAYAAPEQISNRPVTVATDVYSLGVLFYELLTGTSPYVIARSSPGAMEDAVLLQEPQRLLRGDLDSILSQALKKAPSQRYPSVEALTTDIERHLLQLPIHARAPSRWYVTKKFVRRNALAIGVGSAIATALVIGLGVALWQSQEAARQRAIAVERMEEAEDAADFMSAALIEGVGADESLTLEDLLARSQRIAEGSGPENPRLRNYAVNFVARWYIGSGLYAEAERFLTRNIAVSGSSELICTRADAWAALGRLDEAISALDAEIARTADDPRVSSHCMFIRSRMAGAQRDAAAALRFALEAQRLAQASGRQSLTQQAAGLGEIGYAYSVSNDPAKAHDYFEQSLQLFERSGRGNSDASVTVRSRWASSAIDQGMPYQAVELFESALAIAKKRAPSGDPPANLLVSRLNALRLAGRYDDALAAMDYTVDRAERSNDVFAQVYVLHARADIERRLGHADRAQPYLDAAGEKLKARVSPQNASWLRHALFQAQVWAALGRNAQARKGFSDVLDAYIRLGCCGSARVLAYIGRSGVSLSERDSAAALADAESALGAAKLVQANVPYSSHVGSAWLAVARARQASGETEAARAAFQQAGGHLTQTLDPGHPERLEAKQGLMN